MITLSAFIELEGWYVTDRIVCKITHPVFAEPQYTVVNVLCAELFASLYAAYRRQKRCNRNNLILLQTV